MAACSDQQSPNPKISLYSLPSKPINHEPPGMFTPPIHALASVPFKWEEAPGKPRHPCDDSKPKVAARCLNLPPRLLSKVASDTLPSPTTVLDGPYIGRSRSLLFAKIQSSVSEKAVFASTRWGDNQKKEVVGVGFDFFEDIGICGSGVSYDVSGNCTTKVKIARLGRRSSFLSSTSKRSSIFLTSIYESLKQVVPWKRRRDNLMSEIN